MLTVDDIRNVEFTKNLGGYKAGEVDDFLDQCEETIKALLAEKADTAAKMNVLADKLVEYRKDEDSLRTALLDAHKMADQIVKEANEKASTILADARYKAERVQADAKASIAAEQAELKRAQDKVATFKADVLRKYREQIALIEALPGEAKPAKVEAAPVSSAVPAAPTSAAETPVQPQETESAPEQTVDSRYADLKFGEDYDIAEDAAADEVKGRFKRKK